MAAFPTGLTDALAGFDRVWWFTIVGGLLTAACALPPDTSRVVETAPSNSS